MASTALLIGGLAAAGGIGGAALQSGAAQNAASTQSQAADYAENLQAQEAQNALSFESGVWNQTQANQAPFIAQGQGAVNQIGNLLGLQGQQLGQSGPGQAAAAGGTIPPAPPLSSIGTAPAAPSATGISGAPVGNAPANALASPPLNTTGALNSTSLNEQFATPFNAPTAAQAQQTPGEQFEMQQGLQAIQNSAAAQGNLLSGSTLKGLENYGQGLASTTYQQAYNNALQQYQQGYNIFNANQSNEYNRLASLAGLGQTSTAQLGQAGSQAANTVANTNLTAGAQIGQNVNNAAAATASGYVGSANALAGGLSNIGNSATSALLLNQILGE